MVSRHTWVYSISYTCIDRSHFGQFLIKSQTNNLCLTLRVTHTQIMEDCNSLPPQMCWTKTTLYVRLHSRDFLTQNAWPGNCLNQEGRANLYFKTSVFHQATNAFLCGLRLHQYFSTWNLFLCLAWHGWETMGLHFNSAQTWSLLKNCARRA